MDKFKKYNRKMMEDWGAQMSKDAIEFYRAFKSYLEREFPNATLTGFKPNHYSFSGFITENGKTVYIYHSLTRHGYLCKADFSAKGCVTGGVLYRIAEDTKDYHGGMNHFSSIYELADNVRLMISAYDRYKAA